MGRYFNPTLITVRNHHDSRVLNGIRVIHYRTGYPHRQYKDNEVFGLYKTFIKKTILFYALFILLVIFIVIWEKFNWREWHIDHIRPVSKFDKSEKIRIINSLDNLQPLWAQDNLKKSNKLI